MIRSRALLLFGVILAAVYSPLAARADLSWAYTTDNTYTGTGGGPIILPDVAKNGGGISMVSINNGTGGPVPQVGNSNSIILANLYTVGLPGTATFTNQGYNINLAFTYGGQTQTWNIQGQFTGNYSNDTNQLTHTFITSNLSHTFIYTDGSGNPLAKFIVSVYDPIILPGSPSAGNAAGAIAASVQSFDLTGGGSSGGGSSGGGGGGGSSGGGSSGGGTSNTPEPSTLLLAGVGLSLASVAWRKRRKGIAELGVAPTLETV